MLAKALAKEAAAVFLPVPTSSVGSKWAGDSNKLIAAVFSLAKKIAPVVIFIDEIDKFFPSENGIIGQHSFHSDQILGEFLSLVDGIATKEDSKIIVMGATNHPYHLDKALLRRLPIQCEIGLPDEENRLAILETILKKEQVSPEARANLPTLATQTDGYSGSDLKELCLEAAYVRVRELSLQMAQYKTNAESSHLRAPPKPQLPKQSLRCISKTDFDLALKKVKKTGEVATKFFEKTVLGSHGP